MSKLSDALRRVTKVEPRPIGFGSAARKPEPTMLLVALVGERPGEGAGQAVEAGADIVLLTRAAGEREIADAVQAAGDKPVGALIAEPAPDDLRKAREAKADFVAVELGASAGSLLDEDLGMLLHLREDLTDIQLRTLESKPLDAVWAEFDPTPLTIRQQMELERISGLTRKPLLLRISPRAEQDDLLGLRDTGTALVGIDLSEAGAIEAIKRLRGVIDNLPPRRRPRRGEGEITLIPRAAAAAGDEEDDEED